MFFTLGHLQFGALPTLCTSLPHHPNRADDRSARVRLRLVDFAHSFRSQDGARDENFLQGGLALLHRLRQVQGGSPDNPYI